MTPRQKVTEFIGKNPGCKSSQIASATRIPRAELLVLLKDLYVTEVVTRTEQYAFYLISDGVISTNSEYLAHRNRAIELEGKGLWRRASREWLSAMDSTRSEEFRSKAAARRERCDVFVHIREEGSSIGSVSLPEADGIADQEGFW